MSVTSPVALYILALGLQSLSRIPHTGCGDFFKSYGRLWTRVDGGDPSPVHSDSHHETPGRTAETPLFLTCLRSLTFQSCADLNLTFQPGWTDEASTTVTSWLLPKNKDLQAPKTHRHPVMPTNFLLQSGLGLTQTRQWDN